MIVRQRSATLALYLATSILLGLLILLGEPQSVQAQWTTNGNNINNTNTGNVGIGTTSPEQVLHANGNEILSSGPQSGFKFRDRAGGAANNWVWYATGNVARLHHQGIGDFIGITQAGNIGIGTVSPVRKLHVLGGNVFHQYSATAGAEYGIYTAIRNSHFTSNLYFDGQWKMISTGKGAFIVTAPLAGIAFGVSVDNTSRAAGSTATLTSLLQINNDGRVGIGTTEPFQRLQIGTNTVTPTTAPDAVSLGATYSSAAGANPKLRLFDNNAGSVYGLGISNAQFDFIVPTGARYVWNVNGIEKMRLDEAGNLTATGSIAAKYQDVAEWVPSTHALRAGTVVTLDPTKSNHVEASSKAYDTRVAGVISVQPGIALGERGENKVLVATTGRVRIKVDASHGPIQVGDLLVTSDTPGLAMKSQPINVGGVQIHRPGTLVGKALEPLAKGGGEILVLLSLQ